jgi:glycerol-3-phosphate acyltransferase PlsY
VGKLFLRTDIRAYGDANPGATNVFRAGGKGVGLLAGLLDGFKGAIPIWVAMLGAGVQGWLLVATATAPVLGHAFTPFLRFRGGKAVAVTIGIWGGLTVWEGPTVIGLGLLLGTFLVGSNGWGVIVAMTCLLAYLFIAPGEWNGVIARPDLWVMTAVWLLNMSVLIYKHRTDLRHAPALRFRRRARQAAP